MGVAVLRHGAGLALAGLALAGCAGAGAALLRWARSPRLGTAGAVLQVAAGAGLLSLLLTGLALAGLWFKPLVLVTVAAAAAARMWFHPRVHRPADGPAPAHRILWPVLYALPALWAALFAFLPETEVDCLMYHLAAPDQFFARHALVRDRISHAFRLPLPVEMLWGFAVAAGSDVPAKLLHAAAGFGCAAAALTLAGGGGYGRVAGWLFLTTTWSLMLLARAKNDLVALGWLAAALVAADAAWRPGRSAVPRASALALAWCLAGMAVAAKYTQAPAVILVAAWGWLRYGAPPAAALRALAFAPLAAVALLPWWARNTLHFGNPLWFALTGLWPPVDMAPDGPATIAACVVEPFAGPGTGTWGGAVLRVPARWLDAAPAPLLAALVALHPAAGSAARRLAGAAVVLAVALARLGRADRFGLPADLLLSVAGALALRAALPTLPAVVRRTTFLVLTLAGVVTLLRAAGPAGPGDGWRCLAGLESPAAYRARRLSTLEDARGAAAALRPRVLLLAGDVRPYRFGGPVVSTLTYGIPPLGWQVAREAHTPDEAAKRLRQLGVTHAAYNFVTAFYQKNVHDAFPWDDRMLRLWDAMVRTRWRILRAPDRSDHRNGGYYFYEILPRPGPAPALLFYLPGAEGLFREIWQAERREHLAAIAPAYTRLFRVLPGVAVVRDAAAWHAFAFRRWEEALALIRPGIAAGMVNDENWVLYASTEFKLGRLDESEHAYLRARELYPYDIDERDRNLATIAFVRGERERAGRRWPEAERAYRDCLRWSAVMRHAPDDDQALALTHVRLAEALAQLGRPGDAVRELEAAEQALPAARRSPEMEAVRRLLRTAP